MDYRLPHDVSLENRLNVYCTKKAPSGPYLLCSAEIQYDWIWCDIAGILTDTQKSELADEWSYLNRTSPGTVDYKLVFEVTLSGKDEIDSVSLNGHAINDIVSISMEFDLIEAVKEQAKADNGRM